MPPVRTGIAGRSAELVSALRGRGYAVDVFVDPGPAVAGRRPAMPLDTWTAYDFICRHAQQPYDLIVYQFGNSSHHDYMWAYALRFPGLVVLHDTRLHHARAAALLRERRFGDYRAEFAWNHPDVNPDLAELAVAGFDSALYYEWPMVRALVASSRLTAAHGDGAAEELRERLADSRAGELANRITSVRLGEGEPPAPEAVRDARARVRTRLGIASDAILLGVFGGLTPEKRIPQILAALRATIPHAPSARLLLAGSPAAHYEVLADVRALDLEGRVTISGYLDTDADVTDHLAACDVSVNLRWPTARETSGPWLRALAAGLPTVVTDLVHATGFASLDPRTWRVNTEVRGPRSEVRSPKSEDRPSTIGHRPSADHRAAAVCVAIDILDEDHSLRLAMRRLANDIELRARLGAAGQAWWRREHSLDAMVEDYVRVMDEARRRPLPDTSALPAHMTDSGGRTLARLVAPFGIAPPIGVPRPSSEVRF
jgi:glycosyltransferase involved in cell wall biosynthesis